MRYLIFMLLFFGQAYSQENILLLNNPGSLVPVIETEKRSFAAIHIDDTDVNVFDSILNKYAAAVSFSISMKQDERMADSMWHKLHDDIKLANTLLVSVDLNMLGDDLKFVERISSLRQARETILITHGEKISDQIWTFVRSRNIVLLHASGAGSGKVSKTVQAVFGGIELPALKKNPFVVNKKIAGSLPVRKIRLGYGTPGSVGLPATLVDSVDLIVRNSIASNVTPAAVVLLVKDGQVILDKAYGTHTYNGNAQAKTDDIFDMASVTKVTATTPAIMKLYEQQLIHIDSAVSSYVHELKDFPDKKDQTLKDALLHEAGYTPYIKFYEKLGPLDLSYTRSDSFPTEIAKNYFLKKDYFKNVMWPVTLASPVLTRGKYVYSDVSMYMMKAVAENVSHRPIDKYVAEEFYEPLGMRSTGFLPLKRFPESRIVPTTENDNWVRNMQVLGFVNDPGAAMSGGVQGHAGLFSTTNDLAIYYQMLLNKGSYGGRKFFDNKTVELFTSKQSNVSGRGLGFQKLSDSVMAVRGFPSPESYGHSGYTGTYVWADPKYNMIYICLTNRVYPDDGKTFGPAKFNLRQQLLDLFYRQIISSTR